MKYLLLTLLLFSCQKEKPKAPKEIRPEIASKAEVYKSLHKGWAHQGGCDSLGFTALCKAADGCSEADIYQAEGESGRWYRNAGKRCYDDGQSKSDISKDMFAMLFPYLYTKGDKQNLLEIYQYGKANGWVMGRGPYSRTMMTPLMILNLQELLGMLGVQPFDEIEKKDFEKHLDVISILGMSFKRKSILEKDLATLKKYSDASPRNALFAATYHRFKDGDQSQAISILLDEKLFPSDRLPASNDRCEEYLWQRDEEPSDWEPCSQGKTFDGVDFLIAAWVAGQL